MGIVYKHGINLRMLSGLIKNEKYGVLGTQSSLFPQITRKARNVKYTALSSQKYI